jgi:biotin carboxylase
LASSSTSSINGKSDIASECNYDRLKLGNKDGFREFCKDHGVIQLPGGTFKALEEVEKFVNEMHKQGNTVVIKSPHGIGGGGQIRLRAKHPEDVAENHEWKETVKEWQQKEDAVEVEQFADNAESEHVVDIYIDPTDRHHTAVMFDQLVRNDNESAGMAYFGAKYPSTL